MTKIIQRHDTSTNWVSVNPVLALGEMGIETDTNKFKFGDGVTNWTALSYASAEGGGSADLSDYYTKEETDTLLDEKQDVLTPNAPIEIGTNTIGEPNNINIVGGGIIPSTLNVGNINSATNAVDINNAKNSNTVVDTFNSSFKDLPYFDIALNLSNYFTNDYSNQQTLKINVGGMTSFKSAGWAILYFGKLSDNEFYPYIAIKQNTHNLAPILGVLSEQPRLVSTTTTTTQWRANGTVQAGTISRVSDSSPATISIELNKTTSGTLNINSCWFNNTYKYTAPFNLNASQWDLNKLRDCNAIRVVLRVADLTSAYSPTVADTFLEYNGSRLSWNIEDDIVTTYGISLKYDNQTIQVNSEGELVANLDELGNEVNAIASQVTANTTALGGNKIVSLTQAEYDGLTTKDPNTVYIITDGPDGAYALADLSNVPSTVTSIAPTSLTNFDGQWIISEKTLSTATAKGTYTIDLSSYLPNDGYIYEVMFNHRLYCTTDCAVFMTTDLLTLRSDSSIIGQTSGSSRWSTNTFIKPIGLGRTATLEIITNNVGQNPLIAMAFRRIGTNQ